MKRSLSTIMLLSALIALPTAAVAYVGPGAGLSLMGALWAVVAAIGMALALVLAWPVRRMLRRARARRSGSAEAPAPQARSATRQEGPSEA